MNRHFSRKILTTIAVLLTASLLAPALPDAHASSSAQTAQAARLESMLNRKDTENTASSTKEQTTKEYSAVLPIAPDTRKPVTEEETAVEKPVAVKPDSPAQETTQEDRFESKPADTTSSDISLSGSTSSGASDTGNRTFVDANGDGVDDSSPLDVSNRPAQDSNKHITDHVTPDTNTKLDNAQMNVGYGAGTPQNGYQYQGNTQVRPSDSGLDPKQAASLEAAMRTQIKAMADALPEGTSLVVEQQLKGTHYAKALQAARMLAETENIQVFDIELQKKDGTTIHQLEDYVEVRMDIPRDYVIQKDNTVVVYYLSDDGTTEPCATTYYDEDPDNRYLTFRTDHFSVYFFMETSQEQADQLFQDADDTNTSKVTDKTLSYVYIYMIGSSLFLLLIAGIGIACLSLKKKMKKKKK